MVQLARKNFKYYLKQYAVFLVTLVVNAWIFFSYMILCDLPVLLAIKTSPTYRFLLQASQWLVLVFEAMFLLYSVGYFLQKREREFGMYLLLGMKHSEIGRVLLLEQVGMGSCASVAGLLLSLVTAGSVERILARIFPGFPVSGSLPAAGQFLSGLLIYLLVFLTVSALGYRRVAKKTIAELFLAEDLSEKNPVVSRIRGAGSFLLLMTGYILIFRVKDSTNLYMLPTGFGLVVAGTFAVCRQGISLITDRMRRAPGMAVRLPGFISTVNIRHQIRKNSDSWSVISLLIASAAGMAILMSILYRVIESVGGMPELASDPAGRAYISSFALLLTLAVLLGINFIADVGSMMYFKTLAGILQHRNQYKVLYCLGAKRRELTKILLRECGILFAVPFIFGFLHAAMFTCYLNRIHLLNTAMPLFISLGGFAGIYGIYFYTAYRAAQRGLRRTLPL